MTHPLRSRSFRLLFVGRSLSTVSDSLVPAALSLTIVLATGSASALATVLVCAMVPRLLLLPLGGAVADRFDVRRVAVTADLVRCATQAFVGVELLTSGPHLAHLCVAQAVAGAASACALPTTSPLVAGVVEGAARQRANAVMGVSRSVSLLFGPALAAALILLAGPGWVFLVDATAFAVSAALLAAIRSARAEPVPRRSIRADLAEGWAEVRARDWYWTGLVVHAVWNFTAGVLLTLGPVIAVTRLGGEGAWLAVLQAGGIGLLLGSLLAGRARLRRPVLVANLGLATYAVPLALFAVPAPVAAVVAGYGLALVALGFLNPTWDTVVQANVPEHALARVTAYDWLFSLAAQPLGFALGPLVAQRWGPGVPLWTAAALVAVACLGVAAVPGVRGLVTGTRGEPVPETARGR
ncbi:MFS transporter [Saccharothrix syringae]|uniref:MFS transporter n=1 Tax=Saccharothrix syringae TaxID=103733 RepID=A0A5Q0H439_SACSY|nr:MFS transporter [Saccharothrix syringae]QFZ20981.1 MFS transporter [Saccharothrix syringae]